MRNFQKQQVLACLVLLFSGFSLLARGNVIGFDFGSTFFKITLVKPGQPFDIVENTSSGRKTHNQFSITEDSRIFGTDSFLQSTRYTKSTFSQVSTFLGMDFDEEFLSRFKKEHFIFNEFVADDRGLVGWKVSKASSEGGSSGGEEEIFYTEELLAVLLKFGKSLAQAKAGGTVKDCVITIPAYFSAEQRRMMADAADLAGLFVMQLIHENTAAATMYGIDRLDSEKPHTVLFYNMGGKDTEVSIARYSTITEESTNKTYEHIEIVAEAWDRDLGGHHLDLALVNLLVDHFNNMKERKGMPDIRQNPKAMKRLFKEVAKIKDVLSANKHTQVKVSELADYVSLSLTLERGDFYEVATRFFDRVYSPVELVLQKAGLTMADIDQVELLGGGIRVPRVQEVLQERMGVQELGVHLNGDEAMCFGSAFIASNSSASFKVRKVYLTQHPEEQYSIEIGPQQEGKASGASEAREEVREEQEEGAEEGEGQVEQKPVEYLKSYVLYKRSDFLGQKKSVSLTYDTDMKIQVFRETAEGEKTLYATYLINGIDTVATNEVSRKEGSSKPRVTLSFELTRSGLLQLNKAEAKVEELVWVEDKPKKKAEEKKAEEKKEDEENSEEKSEEDKEEQKEEKKEQEEAPPAKKQKKRTQSFPLSNIDKVLEGRPQLSKQQLQAAKDRLKAYEKRDEEKVKTDKAKNDFESVIYAMRDWINEEGNQPFLKDSEVEEAQLQIMRQEDWLYEEGDHAHLTEYKSRYNTLNQNLTKFKERKEEFYKRDSAVESALEKLDKVQLNLEGLEKKKDWITAEQKQDVFDKLSEARAWIEEVVVKQREVKSYEEPAFRVSELEAKVKKVDALYAKVSGTPKPKAKDGGGSNKFGNNFKIDNITIDGNSGDVNWEDFIKIVGNEEQEQQGEKKKTVEDLDPEEEL